jgi:ankyrin repeat protein
LGEQVIFCKLIRDGVLRHLNPWKLSDLQCVLEMRCFKGLLSDEDLKEVYFQRMWGFKEEEFWLAGWRGMSVEDMKDRIGWALEHRLKLIPGMREHLMALGTREEIMREYGMLAYVPGEIANNAMCGVWTLRQVRGVGVENLGRLEMEERKQCLRHACSAGVEFSIISSLYESLLVENRRAGGVGLAGAARGGHLDIIEAFIGPLGVDVDAVDEYGRTALVCAASKGHTATVNALAGTYNANVEAVTINHNGTTALMYAARNGHTATVNALAGTYNANVEAVDRVFGQTALMLAAKNGHTDTVNALAGTYSANVEAVNRNGWTALMIAAQMGHTATVNALAGTYNANVEAVNQHGSTALMYAARNGHIDTVNALAGMYSANVEAINQYDRTALMIAAQKGHTDIVNVLAGMHNANVEAADEEGLTALMHAAQDGRTDIVNALAGTHNANVDAVDRYGWTALMLAAENGHTDTVHALRRHGVIRNGSMNTNTYTYII